MNKATRMVSALGLLLFGLAACATDVEEDNEAPVAANDVGGDDETVALDDVEMVDDVESAVTSGCTPGKIVGVWEECHAAKISGKGLGNDYGSYSRSRVFYRCDKCGRYRESYEFRYATKDGALSTARTSCVNKRFATSWYVDGRSYPKNICWDSSWNRRSTEM